MNIPFNIYAVTVPARILGYYTTQVIEGCNGRPGVNHIEGVRGDTVLQNPIQDVKYRARMGQCCTILCSQVANLPVFGRLVEIV